METEKRGRCEISNTTSMGPAKLERTRTLKFLGQVDDAKDHDPNGLSVMVATVRDEEMSKPS